MHEIDLPTGFMRARQGFSEYVETNYGANPYITDPHDMVDSNLSGIWLPKHFDTIEEVVEEYQRLQDLAKGQQGKDAQDLQARVEADLVRARMFTGEEVDFYEYSEKTVGFIPVLAPIEQIDQLYGRLGDLTFVHKGFRIESDPDRFREEYRLTDSKQINRRLGTGIHLSRMALGRRLDHLPEPVEFALQCLPDAPFSAHLETTKHGRFTAGFNTSPARGWTAARTLLTAFHENGGHAIHAGLTQEEIDKGNINLALGLTNMTSPETAYAEVIASAAELLAVEATGTEEARLALEIQLVLEELKNAVFNNANIRINLGHPEKEVVDEAAQYLPLMDRETVRSDILSGLHHPIPRANTSTYYAARELIRPLMAIKDQDVLNGSLNILYRGFFSRGETEAIITRALEDCASSANS
ncbi:MAG TPA: hypothetical protein VL989_02030 [Candidatus Sulfotelmatobacter sp.]|nr:hypothetical protein [Candidatus Sulfotelmatobacter sp.]